MYPVSSKIMSDAMISKTCALFLSDVDIKPGCIQCGGYMTRGRNHIVHLTNKRVESKYRSIKMENTSAFSAVIRRDTHSSRACLAVKYKWFDYRERQTGRAYFTILRKRVPESILAAVACRKFRLLDIVDMSHLKPIWLVRSNPVLVAAKNTQKSITVDDIYGYRSRKIEVPAIEFTLVDDWSRDNWGYWNSVTGYASSIRDTE